MVNNAGVFTDLHTIVDETEEQYDFTMDVNVKGVWLGCKAAITQMLKQDVRQLALDFAPQRIHINAICPGFLQTAMVRPFLEDPELNQLLHEKSPWPDLGTAEDVGKAALFLASDEAAWVSGSILVVDGAYTAG